jgi:hypothetical protein
MVLGDPLEPVPGTLGQERTFEGNKMTSKKIPNRTEEQIEELLYQYTDALIRRAVQGPGRISRCQAPL